MDELYYYRARYYDPTIQRFISEDPIGFASGDFNFYRYVGDNPVNFTDPSGEFWNYIIGAVLGAGFEFVQQMYFNGWRIECVDWADVVGMGIIGAVVPSMLGAVKSGWKSFKAIRTLSTQLKRARTLNRINKINSRKNTHEMNIINNVIIQGNISIIKFIYKKNVNYPENSRCNHECK